MQQRRWSVCKRAVINVLMAMGLILRRLPPLKIVPAALSEATGTTQLLASYLKAAPGWRLGVSPVLAWPHCVQHIRGAPQMVQAVAETPGAIR